MLFANIITSAIMAASSLAAPLADAEVCNNQTTWAHVVGNLKVQPTTC